MPKQEIGLYAGLILGVAGAVGTVTGGYLADRLGKSGPEWYVKVPGFAAILALPFFGVYYFHSSVPVILVALFIGYACVSTFLGPCIAITHSLVPQNMRAFASAIFFLVLNLIGLGLGPLFVGIVSDMLAPALGVESLRWALASTMFISVIAIIMFFKSSQTLKSDLAIS